MPRLRKLNTYPAHERMVVEQRLRSTLAIAQALQDAIASLYYDGTTSVLFSTNSPHDTTSLAEWVESVTDDVAGIEVEIEAILANED